LRLQQPVDGNGIMRDLQRSEICHRREENRALPSMLNPGF
jgi:hypothetical protein